jgi:SpoVK/Ycf46/Vps4 family AAA+-type ATPase
MLVSPAITQVLEREMTSCFGDSSEKHNQRGGGMSSVPIVTVCAAGGGAGVKELVLELSSEYADAGKALSVFCINTGQVYADSVAAHGERTDLALHAVISRALVSRPALLFIEDLDRLAPAQPQEEQELATGKVAAILEQLLDYCPTATATATELGSEAAVRLMVVAVTSSSSGVQGVFQSLRRRLLCAGSGSTVLTAQPPVTGERAGIISAVNKDCTQAQALEWAKGMAGYSAMEVAITARSRGNSNSNSSSNTNKAGGEGGVSVWGHAEIIASLEESVLWPRRYPEVYEHFYPQTAAGSGVNKGAAANLVSGVLLYGPPGTGKTLLARKVGTLLGSNLVTLSIPQVIRGEIGAGEAAVNAAVAEAKKMAPSVLFVDEFQAIFTARAGRGGGGNDSGGGGADVGQSLSSTLAGAFDSINTWNRHAGPQSSVLVLGATNEPWAVDSGFLRGGRFDKALFVGPLGRQERLLFLCKSVAALQRAAVSAGGVLTLSLGEGNVNNDDSGGDDDDSTRELLLAEAVDRTELYSGADLQLLVQRALQRAYSTHQQEEGPLLSMSLSKDHFSWALQRSEPTTTAQDVSEYRRWAAEMKL